MAVTSFVGFFWVAVFPGEFLIFQKPVLVGFKIGGWHCVNRAVMFRWIGAKKIKTKVQCQKQGLA